MEGNLIKTNEWLTPLSWVYGFTVGVRNWLFDIGVLEERSFAVPVIAVGNLTVGGCGKTPHVEYLVRLLKDKVKVAVLSRGYKRKGRGYVLAAEDTPMPQIGDEPFQMKRKFPEAYIAVDKNRRHGIGRLTTDEATKDVGVILLDDAYQHRYVKPGINILLVDYNRPISGDKLMPVGRLREPRSNKERASIVIVTKCPDSLKPMDYRVLTKALDLRPYQRLYFTSIAYKPLRPLAGGPSMRLTAIPSDMHVLLLSGIASPRQLAADLERHFKLESMEFPDHHQFTRKDIKHISEKFGSLPEPRMIITTEKDAARLLHPDGLLPDSLRRSIHILPIEIEFRLNKRQDFDDTIRSYVRKTLATNRTLHQMAADK